MHRRTPSPQNHNIVTNIAKRRYRNRPKSSGFSQKTVATSIWLPAKTPSIKAIHEFYLQPQLSRCSQVLYMAFAILLELLHRIYHQNIRVALLDSTFILIEDLMLLEVPIYKWLLQTQITLEHFLCLPHCASFLPSNANAPQEIWTGTGTWSVTPNVMVLPSRGKRSYCCTSTSAPEAKPESLMRK